MISHTDRAGETLSSIAYRHGISWQALARHNAITDPNRPVIGQRFRLPIPPWPRPGPPPWRARCPRRQLRHPRRRRPIPALSARSPPISCAASCPRRARPRPPDVEPLNQAMRAHGIATPEQPAAFLAQVRVEAKASATPAKTRTNRPPACIRSGRAAFRPRRRHSVVPTRPKPWATMSMPAGWAAATGAGFVGAGLSRPPAATITVRPGTRPIRKRWPSARWPPCGRRPRLIVASGAARAPAPPVPASAGLCRATEPVLFSCPLGRKLVPVCGTGKDATYRFGRRGAVEMTAQGLRPRRSRHRWRKPSVVRARRLYLCGVGPHGADRFRRGRARRFRVRCGTGCRAEQHGGEPRSVPHRRHHGRRRRDAAPDRLRRPP